MSYAFAGQYGPNPITNAEGYPLRALEVSIFLPGTTTKAALYTDRTKTTNAPNPMSTDGVGNLTFFADPGSYDIDGNGATITVPVQPDAASALTGVGAGDGISVSTLAPNDPEIDNTGVTSVTVNGGGEQTGDIAISAVASLGTTAGTAAEGNDSRIVGALPAIQSYAGSSTDVVQSLKLAADRFARRIVQANGTTVFGSPNAPPFWGTHNAGTVGTGSDFLQRLEIFNTADGYQIQFGRWLLDDGTHFLHVTFPQALPMVSVASLAVSSTAGLASSGTLSFYTPSQAGTLTYTSIIDGTHLGGCTTSGIVAPTDITALHAIHLYDSFGAPIFWLDDFLGMHLNDQFTFQYAGTSPSNEWDIILGFLDAVNRNTGSGITFGSDGNVIIGRSDDGLGNNQFYFTADTHKLLWSTAGLYSDTAKNLGTTLNRWATAFITNLTLSNPLTQANGGTGQTALTNLPLSALGAPTGPLAMGTHKLTGLANGTASDDGAAFGQIPTALPPNGAAGGDLSSTYPNPTVAKVNGVAIAAGAATLASQLNSATTRAASASAAAGEETVLTGTTAAQTLTLPASTAQASSIQTVLNLSTQVWTIAAGAGTTLNYNGTVGSFLLAPNTSLQAILIGTVWYVVGYTGIGQQAAFNQQTANFTNLMATGGTFGAADLTSGTAPSITLPNDGRTYRVEFLASWWKCSVADTAGIALGVDAAHLLASVQAASLPTTNNFVPPLEIPSIVGSGQVLKIWTECGVTGHTVTVGAAAGPGATTPASLAAYRVA